MVKADYYKLLSKQPYSLDAAIVFDACKENDYTIKYYFWVDIRGQNIVRSSKKSDEEYLKEAIEAILYLKQHL
nr:MAG: hypothetical protein DIU66_10710 [Bacillota bacterium]